MGVKEPGASNGGVKNVADDCEPPDNYSRPLTPLFIFVRCKHSFVLIFHCFMESVIVVNSSTIYCTDKNKYGLNNKKFG